MTIPLYPLQFQTIYKDKIWGGNKIQTILGKNFEPLPNCGETWEVSGVKGNISQVKDGPLKGFLLTDLISKYKEDLLGKKVIQQSGEEFPLLVKFIDANDDLSLQVHPNDELAKKRHDSLGKTEMWYILQADQGATLISGFNQTVTQDIYLQKLSEGNIFDILNKEEAKAGDCFFLPAGRVHTIGKGLLIAEIQQTSDVTYRIYDFDRVDDKGNKRELHTQEALDAIDYNYYSSYRTNYSDSVNTSNKLVECPYFITNKLVLDRVFKANYSNVDSFVIYVCVEGQGNIRLGQEVYPIEFGQCVLVPACITNLEIEPDKVITLLESYVP